jgi:hypothetical protein
MDTDGDLAIENGSLVLLDDLAAETAQRLKTKFRFFLGEWHLDTRIGFPLYEKVLIKAPVLAEIQVLCRQTIEGDEGVDTLDDLQLDFDTATRVLSMTFTATLIDGTVLEINDFILEENK